MAKNIVDLVFTEIVERIQLIMRERADVSQKVRGAVKDIYERDLPRKEDWSFLMTSTSLITTPAYNTGTVSATTGSSTITFSSDVTLDSSFSGRQIKFTNSDFVYGLTYQSATSATISPAFYGTDNISSGSYNIFQSQYALPRDFDRFPKNGGLVKFSGGRPFVVPEKYFSKYTQDQYSEPNDNLAQCRIIGTNTANQYVIEVSPPPKTALPRDCEYIKQLKPLRDSTAGTLAISANATSVLGMADGNGMYPNFLDMNSGDYIRINNFGVGSDSEWYKIASIQSTTSLTLAVAFANTSVSAASYTISSALDIPQKMQPAVMYGAILAISADQEDKMTLGYKLEYASVLTDGKRIYKSRAYNTDISLIAEEYRYRR